MRTRRNCVPTVVLRDVLRQEFPPYEIDAWGRPTGYQTREIAREVGVDEKSIARVLDGTAEWTTFEKADRVLTALGLAHEWHTNPALAEVGDFLDSLPSQKDADNARRRAKTTERRREVSTALALKRARLAATRGQQA